VGIVSGSNSLPNASRKVDPRAFVEIQRRGTRSTRQRLEAEDLRLYNEKIKQLELETLAKEVGLEVEHGRPSN